MLRMTLVAATLALAACTTPSEAPSSGNTVMEQATVSGEAYYRERLLLGPGHVFEAVLLDTSRADTTAPVLARTERELARGEAVIPFTLGVDPSALSPRGHYAVRATVEDPDGGLVFTTDTAQTVSADSLSAGRLLMVRAAQEAPFGERRTFGYSCSGEAVTVTYRGTDVATLSVGSDTYRMRRTRTGSGERYATVDGGVSFWSKGDGAMLGREGREMAMCESVNKRSDERASLDSNLLDRTFRIEDVAGRSVPDGREITVRFGSDGQVPGRAACNRYFGSYMRQGGELSFGPVGATQMGCDPATMNAEREFLSVFNDVVSVSIAPNGVLVLRTADGRELRGRPE